MRTLETRSGLVVPERLARLNINRGTGEVSIDYPNAGAFMESVQLLQERIAELEFALEDENYVMESDLNGTLEFSRSWLSRVARLCRLFYLKNPLVKRGVSVQADYVFGQGVSVRADNPEVNQVVQGFLRDKHNRRTLTGQRAMFKTEVTQQTDGNNFFALFTHPLTGAVKVGYIPMEQITDIMTNPDDVGEPVLYRRDWSEVGAQAQPGQRSRTAYYLDWQYDGPVPEGLPVVQDVRVYHVKTGDISGMRFGVPEIYPVLDWAKAYVSALEDDSSRSRSLSKFAYSLTVKGGSRAVTAGKNLFASTVGNGGSNRETNPPPPAGAAWVQDTGNELKPISLSAATLPTDHSRPLRLMVAAGFGFPETFFGDADVGNHATAKSLDRPTELRIMQRQMLWQTVYEDVIGYAVRMAREAPMGALSSSVLEEADLFIDVDWPPILLEDMVNMVEAIVSAVTLHGNSDAGTIPDRELVTRLLLSALGTEDLDREMERLFPKDENGDPLLPEGLEEGALPEDDLALAGALAKLDRVRLTLEEALNA